MGAAAPIGGGQFYALVIGIGDYRDPRIPRLRFTHADAEAFCHHLTDPRRSAFPQDCVKLLLDEQANLFNIKNAVSGWLFQHATADSTVAVYFAGHGGLESDKLGSERDGVAKYLLPWDADPDNLFASALSSAEFHALLNTVKAQRLVMFLDACYAGGVSQGARDLGIIENPFQKLAQGQGRIVIASALPNQRSWEDSAVGHGIFTHHLLEALQGKADADNDGYVSVLELFSYLQRHVPDTARRIARSLQEPLLCGDLAKDLILAVDSVKIAELERQRSEAERRRREALSQRRRRLFELYDTGELPLEAYREALLLLQHEPSDLTSQQARLAELLEALLTGKITVKFYVDHAQLLRSTPPPSEPAPEPVPRQKRQRLAPIQEAERPETRYCIHCGTRLITGNQFCIGCGRKCLPAP